MKSSKIKIRLKEMNSELTMIGGEAVGYYTIECIVINSEDVFYELGEFLKKEIDVILEPCDGAGYEDETDGTIYCDSNNFLTKKEFSKVVKNTVKRFKNQL